jgi:hypothetical protein
MSARLLVTKPSTAIYTNASDQQTALISQPYCYEVGVYRLGTAYHAHSSPFKQPIWPTYLSLPFSQLSILASSVRLMLCTWYNMELIKHFYSSGSYDPPYPYPYQVGTLEIP